MAQQVRVLLTDDIDGSEATETVRFGLDGTEYEIDLSDSNAGQLREVVATYVSVARRVGGQRGGVARVAGKKSSGESDLDPVAVRAWAQENGIEVSPRGRIAGTVLEQYRAARSAPPAPAPETAPAPAAAEKPSRRKPAALFQEPTADAPAKKPAAKRPARAKAKA